MKKIISFLMILSTLNAVEYLDIEYGQSVTNYTDGDTLTVKGYAFAYNEINANYLLSLSFSELPQQSSPTTVSGVQYDYQFKGSGYGIGFAYKVLQLDEIFIAPILSYNYTSIQYNHRRLSDGATTSLTTSSDSDLSLSIMSGYDYAESSFIYISLKVDSDLLESEDRDNHNLKIGITHMLNRNFMGGVAYSRQLSTKDTIDDSTSMSINIGFIF